MNYIQLTNYPLDYFQPLFSEERWDEILGVIDNWINPELIDGKKYKNIILNPETGLTFTAMDGMQSVPNHTWEYMKKRVLEKYLSEEEVQMCNSKAMSAYCEARDKRIYESATKVNEADYSGPVIDGDTFHYDIDELRDNWDYDYPLPDYVYGSTEEYTLKGCQLEIMLDDYLERLGEINEDEYAKVPKIPQYLQEAWDKFVDENSQVYYEIDKNTVVLLDKTLNEHAEYEATE